MNESSSTGRFMIGMLVGGLVGAGTMFFVAPRPGKKTRALFLRKGSDLKDQTNEILEDVTVQAATKARQINKQARKLERRGQAMFEEKKKLATELVEAAISALEGTSN